MDEKTRIELMQIADLLNDINILLSNNDQLNDIIATIGVFDNSISDSISDIDNFLTNNSSWTVVTAEKSYTFYALDFEELKQIIPADLDIKAIIKD